MSVSSIPAGGDHARLVGASVDGSMVLKRIVIAGVPDVGGYTMYGVSEETYRDAHGKHLLMLMSREVGE